MIYIFILLIACVLSRLNRRLTERTRICFLICLGLIIVLLMGLRYRVGIDTLNYIEKYDETPQVEELSTIDFSTTRFEPGYVILCSLCRSVTDDFWLLQLVHSLILTTCVFIFLYKNTLNPFNGIIVYIILGWLYFNTEIIRESLAISFFLLNYENLKKRKLIKYYLLALLSISFQYSALIILFFPFVRKLKFNILYLGCCLLILASAPYLERVNELITLASFSDRVDEHLGSVEELNLNWRIANMIRYTIVPVCAYVLYRRIHHHSEYTSFILLSILFGIGAFAIPIIFSRLANYTLPFVIVYVANLLRLLNKKTFLKNSLIAILLCSQLLYYKEMYHAWCPYSSVFDQRVSPEREMMWHNYFN